LIKIKEQHYDTKGMERFTKGYANPRGKEVLQNPKTPQIKPHTEKSL
jgi:hypothetical protein